MYRQNHLKEINKLDTNKLISFVNSDIYNNAIKFIIEKTGISIDPEYGENQQKFALDNLIKINISIEECENVLKNDYNKITDIIVEKINYYKDIEGQRAKINSDNYSKGFILMQLLEYYLLKEKPNDFIKYIENKK